MAHPSSVLLPAAATSSGLSRKTDTAYGNDGSTRFGGQQTAYAVEGKPRGLPRKRTCLRNVKDAEATSQLSNTYLPADVLTGIAIAKSAHRLPVGQRLELDGPYTEDAALHVG